MSLRNLLLSRSIFVSQSIDVIYYFQSFCLTTTQSPLSEYSLQSNPSKRTENFYQVTALVIFVTCVIKNLYKKSFHLRHQLSIQLGCHQVELTLIQKFYLQLWACATSYCLGQSLFLNLSMSCIIFSLSVSLPHNRHFLNIVCSPTHRNERKIFTKLQHW